MDVTSDSFVRLGPAWENQLVVMATFRRGVLCLLLTSLASGCGGSQAPTPPANLVPVSGTITLGGQPTGRVAINLVPTGTTKGQGGLAISDDAGKFQVIHPTQKAGVEPGEYRVVFSLYMQPNGEPLPPNTSPTTTMSVQAIPAPWSDPGSTSIAQALSVPAAGKSDIAFELPAPKFVKK